MAHSSPYLKHLRLIALLGTGVDMSSGRVYVAAYGSMSLCWLAVVACNLVAILFAADGEGGGLPARLIYEVAVFLCTQVMELFVLKERESIALLVESLPVEFACDSESGAEARDYLRWVNRLGTLYIFYYFLFVSCFATVFSPLFSLPFYPPDTPVRLLPLPVGCIPFETESRLVYAVAYIVSGLAMAACGMFHASSHIIMLSSCVRIKTQLQLLAEFVIGLKESTAFKPAGGASDDDDDDIVRAVDVHVQVIRHVRLFNRSFRMALMVMFQSGIAVIVFTAFQIIDRLDFRSRELWAGFFLMCACLIVHGIFNITGQTIIDQSDNLHRALFACDWPGRPRQFTSSLRVMMTVATKPLHLNVGGIYSLSNESYGNITAAVYSYMNFLLTMRKTSSD